jgi:diguanylate cyclase (GGDEF)-like protein
VEALCDLFRNLGNSLDVEEVLATLDRDLRRLLSYDALRVYAVESGELVLDYAAGDTLEWLQSASGEDLLAEAVSQHRPAIHGALAGVVPDCESDTEAVLVFPVDHSPGNGRQTIAVLALHSETGFSPRDIDLLWNIAPKLAASIANARKYREAAQLAESDPQTGLSNARALFKRLDAELARAGRARTPLAVLQCSLEGLDASGEFYPAAAGRRAFENLARDLQQHCREYDFAARAGDDFVLVLPGFRREFLDEKRAALHLLVEQAGLRAGLPLFARIGDAFFPDEGHDAEDLLAIAARKVAQSRHAATHPLQPAE